MPAYNLNVLFVLLVFILILGGLSMAGKEDMRVQGEIDKHQLLHDTRRAVQADERAALYFYQQRSR
jgi:hypothetical protein